ncbi:MAG: Choline-sulfatase [candidate division BRC1 bacterium ADurb.BinA364]|nr:MAG: Choline-sulfatase [candidate division BRC1 bacterium ADurb.BinA364]
MPGLLAIFAMCAASAAGAGTEEKMKNRPNIVFAFADDWGRYASAYRQGPGDNSPNALIETPNFDRLAREGALFRNAYVTAPSCTPCRSSLLSGQYFWRTGRGAILQCAVWDSSIPSYPLLLEESGYHIGYTWKVWSPGEPVNAPYGGDRASYAKAGGRFNRFSHSVTDLAREMSVEQAKERMLQEVRGNFRAFLDARKPGQPFCYWWGPTNTHRSWERGSGKALWGIEPEALKGRLPAFLPDVPEIREDFADYLGECMAVDLGLGVLLEMLEEIGELDNTLLVASGDHGIPGFPRGKCNLYDLGCEVALAARWPGKIAPGRKIADFVNLMDLAPTFLEAAGETPPPVMTGRSLLPLFLSEKNGRIDPARDFVVTGRERHVANAREGNLPYPQRAIRTKQYLYIRNFAPDRWPIGTKETNLRDIDSGPTKSWFLAHWDDPEWQTHRDWGFAKRPLEELYDLRVDPDYLNNVAESPEYSAVKKELADRLMGVLAETGDPRVVEADCRYDKPPYTDDFIENRPGAQRPASQARKRSPAG